MFQGFRDDPRFLTSRDKAYKRVVNDTSIFKLDLPYKTGASNKTQPESKCPELLANYCDMLLRKTPLSKKLTSDEVEAKLTDVLLVLKYVQNKDVFMRFHKAHLTRRLILDTSADSEKEENMVEWLREVSLRFKIGTALPCWLNKLNPFLIRLECQQISSTNCLECSKT